MPFTYKFPKVDHTADVVTFRRVAQPGMAGCQFATQVLLVKRKHEPFQGCWVFPGGFLDLEKDVCLEDTALREGREEVDLQPKHVLSFRQFRTYSRKYRDPRNWVVTTVFLVGTDEMYEPHAGDDAAEFAWHDIDNLPSLGFDHADIMNDIKAAGDIEGLLGDVDIERGAI